MILYQAPFAITEIDFVPGPFRFQIELGHLDFAVTMATGATPTRLDFGPGPEQWPWKPEYLLHAESARQCSDVPKRNELSKPSKLTDCGLILQILSRAWLS